MIKIIKNKITTRLLIKIIESHFRTMIKYVADIDQNILAIGGELHADAESVLLEQGSDQKNLWGGNLYPWKSGNERHEYTSLINIRPGQDNFSMEIEDETIRKEVRELVEKLLLNANDELKG